MSLAAVNLVNIGLMLVSAAVAFVLPFETFLLAYAVLGPLHYLTQISWLHERQYFAPQSRDWLLLAGLTVVLTVLNLLAMGHPERQYLGLLAVDIMLWCLGWSLVLTTTKDRTMRATGGVVCAIAVFLLHGQPVSVVIGGVFLPTILHVFVFTGAFVLYGALKSRSGTGLVSLVVFVACGAATLFANVGNLGYQASAYAVEAYSELGNMHLNMLRFSGMADSVTPTGQPGTEFFPFATFGEVFTHETSVRAGRFIAFAYTYHYLNWFSKTSVIRWHKVPARRLAAVVAIWVASVALYAIDYGIGLRWLLLLSLAHVVLEFPLDWKTFVAIPRELVGGRRGAGAS